MVQNNREKGITIIALVITIIVLLILASIGISGLGKKGILKESKNAKENVEISEEKSILNISIVGAIKKDAFGFVEEENFNNSLRINIGEGKYTLDSTTIEDKFIVTFINSDRSYVVDKEGNIVEYAGNKTKANVNINVISITSNTIKIQVTVTDEGDGMPENPTYKYLIKESSETTYINQGSTTESTYIFTGLKQDTSYDIQVKTSDKSGNTEKGEILNITTEKIPGGIESGAITFGSPTWNNGKASITINTTKTEYTIEYQINDIDGTWTSIANGGTVNNLKHNDTVYARLTDGINKGDYASVTILDATVPTISALSVTAYDTTTILVDVIAQDNESGIANYKYEYKKSTASTYTTATTTTATTYKYTGLADGTTYNLRVTVVDKAGNSSTKEVTQTTVTANVGPVLASTTFSSKTTNSLTIKALANDENGDSLTYKLYTCTTQNGTYEQKATQTATAGTEVTLTASSLEEYTNYYYYVTATDSKEIATGAKSSAKTYCSGTSITCTTSTCSDGWLDDCPDCNGSGWEDCGSCGGDGERRCSSCRGTGQTECTGGWAGNYDGTSPCSCGGTVTYYEMYCSKCDASGSSWHCSSCGDEGGDQYHPSGGTMDCSNCDGSGSYTCGSCDGDGGWDCGNCGGDGEVGARCSHGYYTSHKYCSHYNTTTKSSHKHCAHNLNGVQHE